MCNTDTECISANAYNTSKSRETDLSISTKCIKHKLNIILQLENETFEDHLLTRCGRAYVAAEKFGSKYIDKVTQLSQFDSSNFMILSTRNCHLIFAIYCLQKGAVSLLLRPNFRRKVRVAYYVNKLTMFSPMLHSEFQTHCSKIYQAGIFLAFMHTDYSRYNAFLDYRVLQLNQRVKN